MWTNLFGFSINNQIYRVYKFIRYHSILRTDSTVIQVEIQWAFCSNGLKQIGCCCKNILVKNKKKYLKDTRKN